MTMGESADGLTIALRRIGNRWRTSLGGCVGLITSRLSGRSLYFPAAALDSSHDHGYDQTTDSPGSVAAESLRVGDQSQLDEVVLVARHRLGAHRGLLGDLFCPAKVTPFTYV